MRETEETHFYQFRNGNRKLILVSHSLTWDGAHRIYITFESDEKEYSGRGISYDRELAISTALFDYNSDAPEGYRITRKKLEIPDLEGTLIV
jgi:hypothetical protein